MNKFWQHKRVLITGHTGFKGSWLVLWLNELGADVYGYSLAIETGSLFYSLSIDKCLHHQLGDIRNELAVIKFVHEIQPDIVIHLAAQPLVLRSYREPRLTWETNVLGTIHIMEAIKGLDKRCSVVMVTTDKVYDNKEWLHSYRENDSLGGHDPYSSSKASMEMAVECWKKSFFDHDKKIRIATARAGNVIGGGDWAEDRIVPDIVRAMRNKKTLHVRHPKSVRPWQHVLEPLSGYLVLAQALYEQENNELSTSFNFGPYGNSFQSVSDLVCEINKTLDFNWEVISAPDRMHEANLLKLNIEKSRTLLNWTPCWDFPETVKQTAEWYQRFLMGESMIDFTIEQIRSYASAAGR